MASYIELNDLGSFASIEDVWAAYPEGGQEGDYCTIDGTKYHWNKYTRMWGDTEPTPTPSRPVVTFDGDVNIQNDLTVAGYIRAKGIKQPCLGLFLSEDSLTAKWPDPEVGMWALVGDEFPATVYVCETEGEWTETQATGGPDDVDLTNYVTVSEHESDIATLVPKSDIADNTNTNNAAKVLSAKQGYELNKRLESIETYELGSSSYDESDLIAGKMYITSVNVGETITGELHAGASACMKLTVVKGDKVVVASRGGYSGRAYCVTDRNNVVIAVAASREDTTSNPVELVANVDGYVYINSVDDEEALEAFAVTHYYSEERRLIEEVEEGTEMVNDRVDKLEEDVYVEEEPEWTQHKYYNTNDNHTIGDNCPPKSGGANSDYDCLDVDLTQGFTKIEFSCKGHWSSAQHYQACAYFFLDSLNKIVGIADTSDYTYLENIYTLSLKPSDIPEGAVKLCLNNKTRGSYSYATPSCVITKIRGGGGTPVPVDTTDIIYLNPGAKNILNNVSLVKADGFATVLTMAHITDTHGDDGNMTRFNEFCSYYGIDTKLHTGDVMYQAYNLNDFDGTLFTDTMIAIGNHDTAHYEGGWNWTGHQGTDCYNRFIAPFATGWGITSVDNRCYYYKDFTAKNIRLIVLDAMAHSTSQSSEQNTWFAARLADTLDSNNAAYGYDVIVAYHYIPSSIDLFDFPFTSEFGIEGVASHSDVVDIVTNFIANGGKFIAWLTGHTHRDYCGKIVRTVNGSTINQVVLSAATGGTDASNQDCARVVDEKSQDLFSIYGIDTTRKLIKIYRVGCDCDVWCRHKETACINYETAEVVIDEEAKDNAPEANSEKGVKSGGVYTALAGKQATLVSGTNIKTINNQSLLGSGNITIQGGGGSSVQSDWNQSDSTADDYIKNKPTIDANPTQNSTNLVESGGVYTALNTKQDKMLIATVTITSTDGSTYYDGTLDKTHSEIFAAMQANKNVYIYIPTLFNGTYVLLSEITANNNHHFIVVINGDLWWFASSRNDLDNSCCLYKFNYQAALVSGTNIKTVNNTSILGSGNLELLTPNYCPIIEDTRSSAVAAITGVAPFDSLVDGQLIILHCNYNGTGTATLELTYPNGQTTGAKAIYAAYRGDMYAANSVGSGAIRKNYYLPLAYDASKPAWRAIGYDNDTTYTSFTQAEMDSGTNVARLVNVSTLHNNVYIVEEDAHTTTPSVLKANKLYDFGAVSSALTIPSLDATNDLVSNALNFWALHFKVGELTPAGTTELSITFPQNPSGIIVDDEPTIKEGDYVEIMITKHTVGNDTDYYASIKVWQAQQLNS